VRVILSALALFLTAGAMMARAQAPTTKIVGIGAATCMEFVENLNTTPAIARDYLAWAQGFMSGILLSRPVGIDESLDLNPPGFGLLQQLEFLRQHCVRNPSQDFSDAVVMLYKRFRQKP
jgi:hypothetical protein